MVQVTEKVKRCKISRYDEKITETPYLTVQVDRMDVIQPETDHLGEAFYDVLYSNCIMRGYTLKFYTVCIHYKDYDYNVVVY